MMVVQGLGAITLPFEPTELATSALAAKMILVGTATCPALGAAPARSRESAAIHGSRSPIRIVWGVSASRWPAECGSAKTEQRCEAYGNLSASAVPRRLRRGKHDRCRYRGGSYRDPRTRHHRQTVRPWAHLDRARTDQGTSVRRRRRA